MPRNAEIVRQWRTLLDLESARYGQTIDELAQARGVTTRTIRRDLDALQTAGFPIYDQKADGRVRWTLDKLPLRSFADSGLTLPELAALYFSRTLFECLAGTPFQADLKQAFGKLTAALPPRLRRYLDQLPAIFVAKEEPTKRREEKQTRSIVAQLVQATLLHRRAALRYYSFASRREKDYQVEPYRLSYGQGGLYLSAYVPEYGQMRTFAVERVRQLTLHEETFAPVRDVSPGAFPDSIGIHHGTPERIDILFAPAVAPYIQERTWHRSQKLAPRPDGSVVMRLQVCADWALQAWVLSFGPFAKVVAPRSLALRILEEIEEARAQYVPPLDFEASSPAAPLPQARLPLSGRRASPA